MTKRYAIKSGSGLALAAAAVLAAFGAARERAREEHARGRRRRAVQGRAARRLRRGEGISRSARHGRRSADDGHGGPDARAQLPRRSGAPRLHRRRAGSARTASCSSRTASASFRSSSKTMLANYKIAGGKFHVAGPSNGGIAAMHVAARQPATISSRSPRSPATCGSRRREAARDRRRCACYMYVGEHDEYRWHDEMQREAEFLSSRGTVARYTLEKGQPHRLETLAGANAGAAVRRLRGTKQGCSR